MSSSCRSLIVRFCAAGSWLIALVVAASEGGLGPTPGQSADNGVLKGLADVPLLTTPDSEPPQADWLVVPCQRRSAVLRDGQAPQLVMTNGLISRSFRLLPNAATVGFDNLLAGAAVLRGVKLPSTARRRWKPT
jgi:hypothetical protein